MEDKLGNIAEKEYTDGSFVCTIHGLPTFPDGCVECKKELGLHMSKNQERQSTDESFNEKIEQAKHKWANLNQTVPIAHFDFAGQSGSTISDPRLFLREGREFTVAEQQPTTFDEAAGMIGREIAGLIIKKQRDYGHDNITAFGEQGIIVRINDKVARLRNLIRQGLTPANEPIDDSYMDLAGYAFIALMVRRGWFELELE